MKKILSGKTLLALPKRNFLTAFSIEKNLSIHVKNLLKNTGRLKKINMNYNFMLSNPNKTDVLLIDENYSNLKFKNLKSFIFDYKIIYLKIFIRSIIEYLFKNKNKNKIKEIYLSILLQKLSPRIIIGHHLNPLIFKIKKYSPKSKIIVYLHHRLYLSQIHDLRKISDDASIDYFFVCDELHKKFLKKYFSGKFIANGLVKNNEIKLDNTKPKFDVAYISEYRAHNYPKKKIHFKFIKEIAEYLGEYSVKYKKKIVIALNSTRTDKKILPQEEINYFKKISPNFIFLNKKDSYKVCNLAKLVVCLNSNLGADFLAREKKVLFLPFLYKYDDSFKNPYFKKNFFYVVKKNNKKIIYNKLNYLLNLNDLFWKKKLKKSKIKIIFNKNNSILKKEISKITKIKNLL